MMDNYSQQGEARGVKKKLWLSSSHSFCTCPSHPAHTHANAHATDTAPALILHSPCAHVDAPPLPHTPLTLRNSPAMPHHPARDHLSAPPLPPPPPFVTTLVVRRQLISWPHNQAPLHMRCVLVEVSNSHRHRNKHRHRQRHIRTQTQARDLKASVSGSSYRTS